MKTVRMVLILLLFASIIALFSFAGCGGGAEETTPTGTIPAGTTPTASASTSFNQEQLEQILNDGLTNFENASSYKFDMDMNMTVEAKGGTEQGKMTVNSKISGVTNVVPQQTQMKTEMTMDLEGLGGQSDSQEMKYDMYIFPDWTYMRMEIPGMGEQWMKMETTEEAGGTFSTDAVNQQLEPLGSAVKIEFLRYESFDGQDCYVLAITPDIKELMEWVGGQQGASGADIDWDELATASDVIKKLNYTCYITRDDKMLKRIIIDMEMEFTAEQAGVSSSEFEKSLMNIMMEMKFYDHNKSFSITLPDEAKGAIEISPDMFSQQ